MNSRLTLFGSCLSPIQTRISIARWFILCRIYKMCTRFASLKRRRNARWSHMTARKFSGLVLVTVVLVVGVHVASAQVTAAISGKVEDASGAAVGGATVAVKSLETGAIRSVTTDEMGNYRVLSLPVGSQEVRAEK